MKVQQHEDGSVTLIFDYSPWSSVSFTRKTAFDAANALLEHLQRTSPELHEAVVAELVADVGWGRA